MTYTITYVLGDNVDIFETDSKAEANNKFIQLQRKYGKSLPIRADWWDAEGMFNSKFYGNSINWEKVSKDLYSLYKINLNTANFTGAPGSGETLLERNMSKRQVLKAMENAIGEPGYGSDWVYFPVIERLAGEYCMLYSK